MMRTEAEIRVAITNMERAVRGCIRDGDLMAAIAANRIVHVLKWVIGEPEDTFGPLFENFESILRAKRQ